MVYLAGALSADGVALSYADSVIRALPQGKFVRSSTLLYSSEKHAPLHASLPFSLFLLS